MHAVFWWENVEGRDYSEDQGLNGRIILQWNLGKYGGKLWPGFM
jgi:hypothetical protein